MSSASGFPVVYFGVLPLPDLVAKDKALTDTLKLVHYTLNKTLLVLVVLHVAAALKHHVILEKLGTYDPLLAKDDENRVKMNLERIQYWLGQGAQATDRVARMLEAAGVAPKTTRNNPKAALPGKAALERAKAREAKAAAAAE